MPLTFAEAYAKVCPEGGPVAPKSKQYNDIIELMRQSGYTKFNETLCQDSAPRIPRTVQEAMRFIETPQVNHTPLKISKREWMSVEANRKCFLNAINKNKTKP
jgi:hypothetical protein